tara:strand:+ start:11299 stop:11745 length:447 start_codon:yes stop_codon:yes gene_type:complete
MPNTPTVRKRTRRLTTETPAVSADSEVTIKKHAVEFYKHNQLSNDHATKAKKARTELFATMKLAEVDLQLFSATIDGRKLNLTAEIAAGRTTTVIDTAKLKGLVSAKVFAEIVSATVTNVTKFAGSSIVDQCSSKKVGGENVSVKPTK